MFRNKRIFIFGGVFISLCMLFLVHGVKSNDKNKEKYFISIEKQLDGKGVKIIIKKNDKKTVVTTSQLEKKNNPLTNDNFQNVYSLQSNDIAEILSNSECEFLDENNKKVGDESLLAIGTIEVIHNPILRFLLSWIFEDKQYVIYCDDANSKKIEASVYGLFQGINATEIKILSCGSKIENMINMFRDCQILKELDLSKLKTDKVKDMIFMFYNCFQTENTSTLICTSSTIKKIIDHTYNDVCLAISDEVKKNLKDNKIYKFRVERKESDSSDDGNRPEIKAIEEVREDTKVVGEGKEVSVTDTGGNKGKETKGENKIFNINKDKETKGENKIFNTNKDKKYSFIKEVDISNDGKVDDIQIVNEKFANVKLVNAYKYTGNSSQDYEAAKNKFLERIKPTGDKYLFAYVKVGDAIQCFVWCKDVNSRKVKNVTYGLFEESEATKIVILSCGNKIENMSCMFQNCRSLNNIIFPDNFNTEKVTNMSYMFSICSSLKELNLSSFNTENVIDMRCMFHACTMLLKLDLSSFNTNNVTNMIIMFLNCFTEKNPSILICKASTIQQITNNKDSRLTIQNEKKAVINKIIANNNLAQVYECSVERVGDNPKITDVKEYKQQ